MNAISPQVLQVLGWTLLHFLWQGAALAALLATLLMVSRSANVRYALGIATLLLMLAAPVITFCSLQRAPESTAMFDIVATANPLTEAQQAQASPRLVQAFATGVNHQDLLLWLVQAWFIGVIVLSARTAGGLLWVARARRRQIEPLAADIYRQCLELQHRMGLKRRIRYGYCRWLDAPAVIGWFRPVVLVTAQALTGLSAQQLQAVIAHELAHIRRCDAFVNLLQIAAEMLLFYHPAVWWVSRRIRVEREVCCDHEALVACGEPVSYARALTLMEEWRSVPVLTMAVNRGPLAERVLRLLGLQGISARSRAVGLGVSVLAAATAVFAGYVFVAAAQAAGDATPAAQLETEGPALVAETGFFVEPEPLVEPEPAEEPEPLVEPEPVEEPEPFPEPEPLEDPQPLVELEALAEPAVPPGVPAPTPPATREAGRASRSSYIDALAAAGLVDLSVDELIAMKVQGITPAYVEAMHAAQLHPDVDELIAMKVHGVTPEYVKDVRRLVRDVDLESIVAMKVQGVTPQFMRELQSAGLDVHDAEDLIAARVLGLTPEIVRKAKAQGVRELTLERLLELQHLELF